MCSKLFLSILVLPDRATLSLIELLFKVFADYLFWVDFVITIGPRFRTKNRYKLIKTIKLKKKVFKKVVKEGFKICKFLTVKNLAGTFNKQFSI